MKANKFERRVQHLSQALADLVRKMEKASDEAFKLVDEGEAFQALLRARALSTQVKATRLALGEAQKAWRPQHYNYYHPGAPTRSLTTLINLDLQSLSHGELGLLLREKSRAYEAARRLFDGFSTRSREMAIAAAPAELERRRAERKSARGIKD